MVFFIIISKASTVKPVYNNHPWDLKKVIVCKRGLIKVRFRLVVDESNRPLLTDGHCSEVVVKAVLTVPTIEGCNYLS